MVDIVITGPVVPSFPKDTRTGQAAVAITAGQVLYKDGTNGNKLTLADADVEASAEVVGIAVCDAGIDEMVVYAVTGATITQVGTTFTAGTAYWCSPTAGGIAPVADVASADFKTLLGVASSTTALKVNIYISGVAVA